MQKKQATLREVQITQIKAEIERLHNNNSGHWQGLSRQVSQNFTPICYNPLQMVIQKLFMTYPMVDEQKRHKKFEVNVEAGRGAGKTTAMGSWLKDLYQQLPRSSGVMIGATYQQMLTRTLPSFTKSLEIHGIFENLHYFIGREPPPSWRWPTPYENPKKYGKFIPFLNGMGIHLISQDVKGDGRGINSDFEIVDEAALLSQAKLAENTSPALRGSLKSAFDEKRGWLTTFRASSTPLTQGGFWYADKEEEAVLNPHKVKHVKATCTINKHNLPPDYLEEGERNSSSKWIFEAEYLNIRPKRIKNGFYTLFSEEKHGYNEYNYVHYNKRGMDVDSRGDADCITDKPLILGVDWGASINAMVVAQDAGREFRLIKSLYVLGENREVQADLIDNFNSYYRGHSNRNIYLWYDNTGNNKTGITKRTRAQLAKQRLESYGWKVQLMTKGGANIAHEAKYLTWEGMLSGRITSVPKLRINLSNARDLCISLTHAQAKQGRKGIEKDKSSERSTRIQRQHATDLSDAADTIIHGMFADKVRYRRGFLPDSTIHSS